MAVNVGVIDTVMVGVDVFEGIAVIVGARTVVGEGEIRVGDACVAIFVGEGAGDGIDGVSEPATGSVCGLGVRGGFSRSVVGTGEGGGNS